MQKFTIYTCTTQLHEYRVDQYNKAVSRHYDYTLIQVGKRQKRRKISQIQEFMNATVEPCMVSYGLTPTTITAVTHGGNQVTIPLSDAEVPCSTASRARDDDETAARTLYLLDRFAVSDECYHEIAQVYL